MRDAEIAIYVHWPFCLSKCPYCDFNSHVASTVDHDLWLQSYLQEIESFAHIIRDKSVRSIFFGGGTPSLMRPRVISGIINKISSIATLNPGIEVTLEANPTSFEIGKFKDFKLAGVNRISIGVQALNDDCLRKLGRKHSASLAVEAIKAASGIFNRLSFDLIYARSDQTLKAWQVELKEACKLTSGHISLYQLTIEKGTEFYKSFNEGKLNLPTDDLASRMYEWTTQYMQEQGYTRYEISNYATLDHESIHNLTYWNYGSYLGIGPGAHSRIISRKQVRSIMMLHKPNNWLKAVSTTGSGIQSSKILTDHDGITECLMMGLRLASGVHLKNFWWLGNLPSIQDLINKDTATNYQKLGLLTLSQDNIALTDRGLSLHQYIVARLLKVH